MELSPLAGMTLHDAVGFAGVFCYLGAYAALQSGRMGGETYSYAGLNLLAASLVLISLTRNFNAASAAIQVSWIVISVAGIARLLIVRSTRSLDAYSIERSGGSIGDR